MPSLRFFGLDELVVRSKPRRDENRHPDQQLLLHFRPGGVDGVVHVAPLNT